VTASSEDGDRVIPAGGGVVWRSRDDGEVETAVIHRPKYDDWSLPKGKLDAGEHVLEAAVREVGEETGLTVVTGRRSVSTRYPVPDGVKSVDYWLMRAVGGDFAPNAEVDELRWLPLGEACELLSHDHDRAVVDDLASTAVPREPALLLVRHGRAGSRQEWDGPDDLRPLDEKGRRQAERLAAVLPLFAPTTIFSAERVRCRQTVEPLADRLGLPVLPCPELGEEEFEADPHAGLAVVERLLEPRDTPGVTVVCSQGGAIPSVLMAFGVRPDGVEGKLWPPSAKGSTWALGGKAGALVADYYRDFAGSAVGFQDGRDAS
jgi:8-oxo-dGTP pyrophosphatase MutT (NUDIX family)